ncbi:hypothetical protein KM908_20565 [Alkalihalobacillus clausii]|jgi:hypothetical protein|uniref:hypothetical protein n=1 Tax=Shouchella clausii TaxID=79880 RepID=UPI001C23A0FC|nr:hypothetical protein [Shouchella clausii]MBU8598509.1 hypothetical protein [Shouchella clausii]
MNKEMYTVVFRLDWGDLSNQLVETGKTCSEAELIKWVKNMLTENPILKLEVIRVFDSFAGYRNFDIKNGKLVSINY